MRAERRSRRIAGRAGSRPGVAAAGDPAALRRDLAGRGMRLTGPRALILALLRTTDEHPTAEWVHAEVRRRRPRVSLATVYRNLRLLARHGLLAEIHGGSSLRFDARVDRHHHFTCAGCQRIFDLAEPVDPRLETRVAARTGLRIWHHRIEFYGLCAACAPRSIQPRPHHPSPSYRGGR